MNTNYSLTGLVFNNTAASFTIGSTTGNALTLTGTSVINNSPNTQTVNVPVGVTAAAQNFNAAAGNLVSTQTITNSRAI